MNYLRLRMSYFSIVTVSFSAAIIPLASGCDSGPRQTVAPAEPVPVDKEQFSDAKLTFKNENVTKGRLILEKGKEYEYSGSFRLSQADDETPEYPEYIERVRQTLRILFIIDGDESGYKPIPTDDPQNKPVREVTVGSERVSNPRVDASNVVHFEGKVKAPKTVGEQELRICILDEERQERVYIISRPVTVVEGKAQEGI